MNQFDWSVINIYNMSVCRMSVVCQINCVCGITYGLRACSKSFFLVVKPVTPALLGERSEPEISDDIYMSVGRSVCLSCTKMRRWNYVRACEKVFLAVKTDL